MATENISIVNNTPPLIKLCGARGYDTMLVLDKDNCLYCVDCNSILDKTRLLLITRGCLDVIRAMSHHSGMDRIKVYHVILEDKPQLFLIQRKEVDPKNNTDWGIFSSEDLVECRNINLEGTNLVKFVEDKQDIYVLDDQGRSLSLWAYEYTQKGQLVKNKNKFRPVENHKLGTIKISTSLWYKKGYFTTSTVNFSSTNSRNIGFIKKIIRSLYQLFLLMENGDLLSHDSSREFDIAAVDSLKTLRFGEPIKDLINGTNIYLALGESGKVYEITQTGVSSLNLIIEDYNRFRKTKRAEQEQNH